MGGCYSAQSAEAFKSPKHRLPRDRPFGKSDRSKKNGKLVEREEKYAYGDKDEEKDLLSTENTEKLAEEEGTKEVVPSDSGIESLSPNSIKDESDTSPSHNDSGTVETVEMKPPDVDWYNKPSDTDVERTPCDQTVENDPNIIQTYCSCGPRQPGSTFRHNNKCQTHTNITSPKSYRNSDLTGLKSSFKDFMRKTEKHVRLSWKSSDSLDINNQLASHLDRAKSEQSDIFKDDVSFCAPLAQFDSMGGNLDRQNSKNRMSTLSTASEIEAVARDICNCEFYANNLASELDVLVPERDGSCPSESPDSNNKPTSEADTNINNNQSLQTDIHTETITGTDNNDNLDTVNNKMNEKHVVKQISLASLSSLRPSLSSLGDVTLTTYEGRDMVMIDVETYTQILEELQLLKTKLSQLTTIIQEDPALDQAFQMMDAYQLSFDDCMLDHNVDSETE